MRPLTKYTYKLPNMQSNWETEVHEDKHDCRFELGYQNANKTSLEYVRVEEQQKDNNDRTQNAHVLNSGTMNNNHLCKFSVK